MRQSVEFMLDDKILFTLENIGFQYSIELHDKESQNGLDFIIKEAKFSFTNENALPNRWKGFVVRYRQE